MATMQQRRETWGSQSKLDVQEPMIFILQSTVEKLSVGDKIPLSDADSFLIHQESGVLNYELHYLMNGTPQEYNAYDTIFTPENSLKKLITDAVMDGIVGALNIETNTTDDGDKTNFEDSDEDYLIYIK